MKKIKTYSFDYDGQNSVEYGLVIGGMSISDDVSLGLSREIFAGSLNRYRNTVTSMGTQWSDVLSFEISFVKNPCEYPEQDDMIFSEYEINEIASWLTSPDYPVLLHMYDDDLGVFTEYDYFGLFNDLQPQIFDGDIIGLNCTFTTNSPFAWTQEINEVYDVHSSQVQIYIIVDSAERYREINPVISITATDSTIFELTQNSDNKTMILTIPSETTVILDCQNYLITDSDGNPLSLQDLNINDLSQFYWPKFYNGENVFIASGNAELSFTWREPRKVGAY